MATQSARAWTYTAGYSSLHLSTITPPTPDSFQSEKDGARYVLVQIKAAALNPVDIQLMGLPSWSIPWNPLYGVEKGCVCDFSGTILAGGEKSGFKPGDDVFGLTLQPMVPKGGALAEVAVFEEAKTVIVKKPKEWSHVKASAISLVWLTAKASVESVEQYVDSSPDKRVAILGGSSATGIYSAKLAKRKGWTVAATSSSRNKDFLVKDLGVTKHIDYTSENVREALLEFAPDAVIDCVGGTEAIGLPSSKRYISIVGDKTGRMSMGGPYTYYDYLSPVRAAMQWFRWTRGSLGWGESYDVIRLAMRSDWLEEAKKTLTEEEIYIDSTFGFEKAKEAFERLNTGRAKGKVVVEVGGGGESIDNTKLLKRNI